MTTFYDFAIKVETSWAEKVVNPILETWKLPMILLCMFGLFIPW